MLMPRRLEPEFRSHRQRQTKRQQWNAFVTCAFVACLSLTQWISASQLDIEKKIVKDLQYARDLPTKQRKKQASRVKSKTPPPPPLSYSDWRSKTRSQCRAILDDAEALGVNPMSASVLSKKQTVERNALRELEGSGGNAQLHPDDDYASGCSHAFVDLGTNVGDSIGHFVSRALDACGGMWEEESGAKSPKMSRPVLDVTELKVTQLSHKPNPLSNLLRAYLPDPDRVCVYGMEGNPEFTDRLRKLERYVMTRLHPRPLRHLHIHTESVVTDVDGPTKLYLDKYSVEHNFWGSSVLQSQQDVQRSAVQNGGEVAAADVRGMTLSTLVRKVNASGTLVIKMDVEGAEYRVLKEVAASGALCRRQGRVVLIVEWHNNSITDPTERAAQKRGTEQAKKQLAACGVEFANLGANWK